MKTLARTCIGVPGLHYFDRTGKRIRLNPDTDVSGLSPCRSIGRTCPAIRGAQGSSANPPCPRYVLGTLHADTPRRRIPHMKTYSRVRPEVRCLQNIPGFGSHAAPPWPGGLSLGPRMNCGYGIRRLATMVRREESPPVVISCPRRTPASRRGSNETAVLGRRRHEQSLLAGRYLARPDDLRGCPPRPSRSCLRRPRRPRRESQEGCSVPK